MRAYVDVSVLQFLDRVSCDELRASTPGHQLGGRDAADHPETPGDAPCAIVRL